MDAQLKEFIASNEEEFEHYAEKVWDLARALACTYCETEEPTPEQVSWYVEDADVVAEDIGPGPYSIQKLEAQGNFSSVLIINDWLCGAEEGEGFISLSPIAKLPGRLSIAGIQAEALRQAAEAIDEDPYDEYDPYYAEWLRARAKWVTSEA